MENLNKIVTKLFAAFEKLASANTSAGANYSIPELYMSKAIRGDEKAKQTLITSIANTIGVDYKVVEIAFNTWLNGKESVKESKAPKQLIRLTESDLHRIIKESVNRALKETHRMYIREGIYDPDDDNEIFDVGFGGKYRVTWEFKVQERAYQYKTVSEGQEIVKTKEEAYDLYNALRTKYKGTYATRFIIERLIITLSDDRWDTVIDSSNQYLR